MCPDGIGKNLALGKGWWEFMPSCVEWKSNGCSCGRVCARLARGSPLPPVGISRRETMGEHQALHPLLLLQTEVLATPNATGSGVPWPRDTFVVKQNCYAESMHLCVCVCMWSDVSVLPSFWFLHLLNAAVLGRLCCQESCVFRVLAALQNQMCKTPLKMLCRLIYTL